MSDKIKTYFAERPELTIFLLTVVFSVGVAWRDNTALADRVTIHDAQIKVLQDSDRKKGEALARIEQRLEDIADGLGIPKHKERIINADE
jgi:hypothetical protein